MPRTRLSSFLSPVLVGRACLSTCLLAAPPPLKAFSVGTIPTFFPLVHFIANVPTLSQGTLVLHTLCKQLLPLDLIHLVQPEAPSGLRLPSWVGNMHTVLCLLDRRNLHRRTCPALQTRHPNPRHRSILELLVPQRCTSHPQLSESQVGEAAAYRRLVSRFRASSCSSSDCSSSLLLAASSCVQIQNRTASQQANQHLLFLCGGVGIADNPALLFGNILLGARGALLATVQGEQLLIQIVHGAAIAMRLLQYQGMI